MWTVFGPLSLGRRIVATVALGLALVLLLFGLVALWTIRESAEAAYRERVTLAQALVRRVDDVLSHAQATLDREVTTLGIEPGQPLTNDQRQRLVDLRLQMGIFVIITVADADGNAIWTDPSRADVVIGKPLYHPGVRNTLRTGEPQVNEFRSQANGEKIFACLAVPIHGPHGNLVGALMAEIEPNHPALNLLPVDEVADGLHIQLMSSDGRLLAGSEGYEPGGLPQHQALLSNLMAARSAGYRIHEPPPWGEFASHVVAYAPVSRLPSWGIIVEQPKDVVLAMPYRLQQRLFLFGVGALLLAAAVAWFDTRRVVRPLKHLTAAAERFAAGQLDVPVDLARTDELGILAHAFETMRRRLRASLTEVAQWNRELERRVAARTAEVEGRNRELAHLNAIAATVSGSLDVKDVLERTLERVLEITGAAVGCFWVTEEGGTRLVLAAERGLPPGPHVRCVATDECLCGRAIRLRAPVIADGVPFVPEAATCLAAGLPSCLAVPLPSGEDVQGVLGLGSHRPGHFEQMELATLATIGQQVGMALANARLYQSLRTRERERTELLQRVITGQEEERRRLAQELHDEASQALATLQLGLERLATADDRPEDARRLAQQLRSVAAQTLAEVHRLAVELRPSVLDDVGLVAAIERYLQEYAARWGLAVDFAAVDTGDSRLIPAAETATYRIVQAALTNVANHARARHVSVLIKRRGTKLVVVVEDDGAGFDLAAVRAASLEKRLGLAGMEERASLIGATLTIETAPGAGTTIFLEVPLSQNGQREEADVQVAYRPG